MNRPEFSEFQLEQLVNFEIIMKLFCNKGKFYFPFIPNLIQEKKLGYDTGFYFPWLPVPGNPNHKGWNFFIQYKLSVEITGQNAPQYVSWNTPYFKFNMPHRKKNNATGTWFDDYTQYQNLRKLAMRYQVYYATNQILSFHNMIALASSLNLLNEVPLLNVSLISKQHKTVTFTQSSKHFKLHSEVEKVPIQKWEEIYAEIKESKKTNLSDDLIFLKGLINNIEKEYQLFEKDSYTYRISKIDDMPDDKKFVYEIILVSMYLKRYLNVNWFVI